MGRVPDTRAWPKRLRLADEFWFISHDDSTGRPRLGPVALGLGLAGALLSELVISGTILVGRDGVRVVAIRPPDDATCRAVANQMLAEPQHDLRTWLAFLRQGADEMVVTRLYQAGLLVRQPQRRLFASTVMYRPVDSSMAFWRSARLKQALTSDRGLPDGQDIILGGLIRSAGLLRAVLVESFTPGDTYLRSCLSVADHSVREIIAQVATLVGDAVLAVRG